MPDKLKKIDEIMARGIIASVIPDAEEFKQRLYKDKLRFYIGADPTSSALHLSHAKNYMLLEEFRQLGHEVIVLFGDFTGRIGDPTDRDQARKQLSAAEVKANVRDWLKQIKPLMDFAAAENPPRVLYNNDWLSKLTMKDVVDLAANVTVQRMLERDMFEKRLKENKPIFLHEFMYPLMQGYDSVAMDVDVELCGTDQIFNALVGRTLQKRYNDKDKMVVAVNLMENPKTGELMSKSKGTGVFLSSTPFDMYGAIMSQPDEMIEIFLINNTRLSLEEIGRIKKLDNPRDAKMITAKEIVRIFHGDKAADEAQERFVRLVQNKELSGDIPEIKAGRRVLPLFELLKLCLQDSASGSDIRRLIAQNSIKIENKTKNDFAETISLPDEGAVVKIGKKQWFKVRP